MDWRTRKQIAYGGAFFLILGIFICASYFIFFRERPSCFDGLANQDEEGVDCGGICGGVCIPANLTPIKLLGKVQAFYAGSEGSTLAVRVQNPNDGFAARRFIYDFIVYDEGGTELRHVSGESFIYEHEIKYLLFPNLDMPADRISSATVTFRDPVWVPATVFPRPAVRVENHRTDLESRYVATSGEVSNNDTVALTDIVVAAVFHGRFGEIAGASETRIDTLAPGETRSFTVLHTPIAGIQTDETEVFVFARRP